MFPTCSPFPFVARKRLSRISRPRAKFVEGERRDSNPRPPGPQPGRSRRSRAASVLRSPEMDATKMRPRPFGEPVQARPRVLRPSERFARMCGDNVRDTARPGKRTTGLEPATFGLGINGSIRPHNEAGIRHPSSFDTKPVRPHRRDHSEGHAHGWPQRGHRVTLAEGARVTFRSPRRRSDARVDACSAGVRIARTSRSRAVDGRCRRVLDGPF
jgi:hypothetical protein